MNITYNIKGRTGFDIVKQLKERATIEHNAVANRLASMHKSRLLDKEKTRSELFVRQLEVNFFDQLTIDIIPPDPSADVVTDDSIGAGYQVIRNNQPVSVRDLTKQQLIEELVKAMDHLERFEGIGDKLNKILEDWRDGVDAPKE